MISWGIGKKLVIAESKFGKENVIKGTMLNENGCMMVTKGEHAEYL